MGNLKVIYTEGFLNWLENDCPGELKGFSKDILFLRYMQCMLGLEIPKDDEIPEEYYKSDEI